jgi:beta-galactosidase
MLAAGGGANLYMGGGGTNFGFWSGANGDGQSFQPQVRPTDSASHRSRHCCTLTGRQA